MYLYFTFSPKTYASTMLPSTRNLIDLLRWKISKGIPLRIDPIHVMVSDSRFYSMQELVILALYSTVS